VTMSRPSRAGQEQSPATETTLPLRPRSGSVLRRVGGRTHISSLSPWRKAVSTDNGSEFASAEFRGTVERHGAHQRRIKAGRPTSNGCVERAQLTILEECWRPSFARSLVPKVTALRRDLDEYLAYYNFDRPHTGRLTKGRVPGEIVYGARKMGAAR
jgi:integrase-like protein